MHACWFGNVDILFARNFSGTFEHDKKGFKSGSRFGVVSTSIVIISEKLLLTFTK